MPEEVNLPPPANKQRLPDEPDDSEDEGMSDELGLESPPHQSKLAAQHQSHKTRNKKKTQKKEAQIKELADSKRTQDASRPGRIPDGLGVVHLDGHCEHDNAL